MLREHPTILSLSEFIGFLGAYGVRLPSVFPSEPIDGAAFWSIIAAINPLTNFAFRHGIAAPEQLYPCDTPSARFTSRTGVPAILVTTLPHLTSDHDALFDVLAAEVASWPQAAIGDHYQRLFGWLAERFGKQTWVERSGTSLRLVEQLLATFPDAKFLHITRDGRDAAISMQTNFIDVCSRYWRLQIATGLVQLRSLTSD